MTVTAIDTEIETLISRLQAARAETDDLFQLVKPEAMYDRPIPERHRIVFYVGHLEAFDWNLLKGIGQASGRRPDLDRLFAFGIDPVGGNLPTDRPKDWPRLAEVHEYCSQVRESVDELLLAATAPLLHVAIEHRLMHAETLAYIFHQMPFERKKVRPVARVLEAGRLESDVVWVPFGNVSMGLRRDAGVFGWDNEFDEYSVTVDEFRIDRLKVTNGQFLRFLDDGGYDERRFWTDADWEWRCAQNISHPAFWARTGNEWSYRSMFDAIPLPADWPVFVSHAEASAYTRWAGKRLPTEAEWQRAADCGITGGSSAAERDAWGPAPVNAGLVANGWEWTSTLFGPFPGFRTFACYPGYSEPFFDDKHYVLKGGSMRTDVSMLRRSFRNWFQPHYQYVYSGFRCVSGGKNE